MTRVSKGLCFALVVVWLCGCSFDTQRQRAAIVEQATDKFHQQLNQEQYQEIYQAADPELKANVSEGIFVERLKEAHTQLGTIDRKANAFVRDGILKAIKRNFSNRELINHFELQSTDLTYADEHFAWALVEGKAHLVSYEFRIICTKPCAIGIGPA